MHTLTRVCGKFLGLKHTRVNKCAVLSILIFMLTEPWQIKV